MIEPSDPAKNVFLNTQAVSILKAAMEQLQAMGLHCSLMPNGMVPDDAEVPVTLHVAPSEKTLVDRIAGDLLAAQYVLQQEGAQAFDLVRADFVSHRAIFQAMASSSGNKF